MKVTKTLDVKTPCRGTSRSAGVDFFVPNDTMTFREKLAQKNPNIFITDSGFSIPAHKRVNIPSGIMANVPTGFALIAFNKSGVSLNYGLDVGACVVDEDYQGEIHLSLVNTSNEAVFIEFGQKIVQFILLPVFYDNIYETTLEDCFDTTSERGSGGFGSTGTK